jgi:hypothetical protein
MPSGTSSFPAVCQPARSSTNKTRLSSPAPTCSAKWASAKENASALTVGRISQKTSPVSGLTKP